VRSEEAGAEAPAFFVRAEARRTAGGAPPKLRPPPRLVYATMVRGYGAGGEMMEDAVKPQDALSPRDDGSEP